MATKKASTTKPVRNLSHLEVKVRLGSKKEPYHIDLKPRGYRGDVQYVPIDLMDHPAFMANNGLIFEVITKVQADKIQYEDFQVTRLTPPGMKEGVQVTRQSEAEVVVARFNLSEKGKITDVERHPTLTRRQEPISADEVVGPKRAKVRGTEDNPVPTPAARYDAAEPLPTFKGTEKAN